MRTKISLKSLQSEEILHFADLAIDLSSYEVSRDGRRVHLSPTEFCLLSVFLNQPGKAFTREELVEALWDSEVRISLRTVDSYVGRLRRSLTKDGEPSLLRTVRSVGYILEQPKEENTKPIRYIKPVEKRVRRL